MMIPVMNVLRLKESAVAVEVQEVPVLRHVPRLMPATWNLVLIGTIT